MEEPKDWMTEHQDKMRVRGLTHADKLLDLADEKAALVRKAFVKTNEERVRFKG